MPESVKTTEIKRWAGRSSAAGFCLGASLTALILLFHDPYTMPSRDFYSLVQTYFVLGILLTIVFRIRAGKARRDSGIDAPKTQRQLVAEADAQAAAPGSKASQRLHQAQIANRH